RLRKAIDLLARVVHGKRGAAGCGHAIPGEERHDAMRTGAHGYSGAVDDCRHVVRMRALKFERDDRPLVLRGAEDAQRIDLAQTLVSVAHELCLVRADAQLADGRDIVNRGAKSYRLDDRRRTGSQFVRRVAVSDVILKYFADHLATAVEWRHCGKVLVFAVKDADTG